MDWTSSAFVEVLSFLLPGFVAAWVFHGLTPYPKPPQFERLVHALILTAIVNALATVGKLSAPNLLWNDQSTLALSVALAFGTGSLFALLANRDLVHRLLRKIGTTTLLSGYKSNRVNWLRSEAASIKSGVAVSS
jgi:chromate transport protein ChrA